MVIFQQLLVILAEAAVRRCFSKLVFFKISQYSHENTRVGVSEYPQFFKKRLQHRCFSVNIANFLRTAFYRTSLVAASVPVTYSMLPTQVLNKVHGQVFTAVSRRCVQTETTHIKIATLCITFI